MKRWSQHEERKLRKALREGGFPLAYVRLPRRTQKAIQKRAYDLGLDPRDLGGLRVATTAEIMLELGVSDHGARRTVLRDPLHIRRGKYLALPRCRLSAMLSVTAPPVETVKTEYLLTSREAAIRMGVGRGAFNEYHAPRLADVRVPVSTRYHKRAYLYPLDAVTDLIRERAA